MSESNKNNSHARSTHALFFELEFIAIKGRVATYSGLKRACETKGVELTPAHYCRSGMSPVPRSSVTEVLKLAGKKTEAIEKAVAEVEKTLAAFCAGDAQLDAGLEALVKAARARNVRVLAFTALPEAVASALMNRLGLTDLGVELVIPEDVRESFPRADSWLKMLKKSDTDRSTLVAVISSQTACKGALTAGAACIVVPDEYTEFQDFSGAKLVLSTLDEVSPDEILDMTLRM